MCITEQPECAALIRERYLLRECVWHTDAVAGSRAVHSVLSAAGPHAVEDRADLSAPSKGCPESKRWNP